MEYNARINQLREDGEFPFLQGTYLDHAGSTLYSKSLVDAIHKDLLSNCYGNPHSHSRPAKLSHDAIETVREETLRFFKADPNHFDLIFTANATAAMKLVADCFRDLDPSGGSTSGFTFLYHKDSHTSLVGMRAYTQQHHCFANDAEVRAWIKNGHLPDQQQARAAVPQLFAYPGQSNMTGCRLPLSWCKELRMSRLPVHRNTFTLFDAAALSSTAQIDLSEPYAAPDFTTVSFYKIFGLPDLGALIVRKRSGHILFWRRYFGGGTIQSATVLRYATQERKEDTIHEGAEDGTLPFHNIVMLGHAIKIHEKLYGSMAMISAHTSWLVSRLYSELSNLHHSNHQKVCEIYHAYSNPRDAFSDSRVQGSTIAFNVMDLNGAYIPYTTVEELANSSDIYVRSGGLCNPGGVASYLQLEPWQFRRAWSAGHRCSGSSPIDGIEGPPLGVVRVSFGAMSTLADLETFVSFMRRTFISVGPQRPSFDGSDSVSADGSTDTFSPSGHGVYSSESEHDWPSNRASPCV